MIACSVREGDEVDAGDLLVRLGRARGDSAAMSSARAELEREKLEVERLQRLVAGGALPGEQLDQARVRMSAAKAKFVSAAERLGDYGISAPWSGLVSKVHVAVGDLVAPRTLLLELFDPKSVVLRFAVPESHAARVRLGASIELSFDAFPNRTFQTKVTRVYPEIDRVTHTRFVESNVPNDVEVVPGMFARLRLTLDTVQDAITVPRLALLERRKSGTVVVLIDESQSVHVKPVRIGVQHEQLVQVVEGVEPGQRVAIAGHTRLRDGIKVRVAKAKGKTTSKAATPSRAKGAP